LPQVVGIGCLTTGLVVVVLTGCRVELGRGAVVPVDVGDAGASVPDAVGAGEDDGDSAVEADGVSPESVTAVDDTLVTVPAAVDRDEPGVHAVSARAAVTAVVTSRVRRRTVPSRSGAVWT